MSPHSGPGGDPGVAANQRLTALAGAALLALFVAEVATLPDLGALLSPHVIVGVLLAGPLAVKLGSTGWRFFSYYAGAAPYVRKGPPPLALRLLAPLLIVATLAVLGSGVALLVAGPTRPGPFVAMHVISTLVWFPAVAIHVAAHLPQLRLVPRDWTRRAGEPAPGRWLRSGVTLGALAAGAVAALLVSPAAAPWIAWFDATRNAPGIAFGVVGVALAVAGVLVTRPLRWR
jgi:hypothetical protein